MTHVIIYIDMISNYARKESINMNSNTDCYPSGPPGLTRTMSVAPPTLTRSMSVAPPTLTRTMSNAPPALSRSMSVAPSGDTDMQLDMGEDDDEEYDTMRDIYRMKQAGNAALLEVEEIRMFKNYIVRQKRLLLDQYAVVSDKLDELGERGWLIQNPPTLTRTMSVAPSFVPEEEHIYRNPPTLTRTMSIAPSNDMDIHLDLGEGGEYDTMRDIGGMKQLGLASRDEINIFNDYVAQMKSQLLDHYADMSNILEELGERGWLIQNLHELLGEYTHRNRLVPTDFEAEQPLVDICPPGLTRSITISIPSAMDVDQLKGPVALTRSINTANDIFGFTEMASPFEPNRDIDMN